MAIKLPTTKLPAATQDPQNLIIYGLPKIGKTTVLSTLDDNLILDFGESIIYNGLTGNPSIRDKNLFYPKS